jgi:hypothetical protein
MNLQKVDNRNSAISDINMLHSEYVSAERF